MTSPPFTVIIRPPLVLRTYVVAFLICWVGLIVWTTMIRGHGGSAVVGAVMIVLGLGLGYRLVRVGATASDDGTLLVRNSMGTRVLSRSDIQEFRLGASGGTRWGEQSIQAQLRDGTTYGIDVSRVPLGLGRKKNAQRVDQLTKWLESPG